MGPSVKTLEAAVKTLATATTDADFAAKKKTFMTPEVKKAYGTAAYFQSKACKTVK